MLQADKWEPTLPTSCSVDLGWETSSCSEEFWGRTLLFDRNSDHTGDSSSSKKTKCPSNLWQHTGGFFQARSDWSILIPNKYLKGLSTGKDSRHRVLKSKVIVSGHFIINGKRTHSLSFGRANVI